VLSSRASAACQSKINFQFTEGDPANRRAAVSHAMSADLMFHTLSVSANLFSFFIERLAQWR
jgi:hypothetical protein